jgi:hypothetical protein
MNKSGRFTRTIALTCLIIAAWLAGEPARAQTAEKSEPSILFVGNSFTYAAGSPVRFYRNETVTDLNGTRIGGVPALFKLFAEEAGRNFRVSLETSGGKNLDWHLKDKAGLIGLPWNYVVLQGYSTLDEKKPGDPSALILSVKSLAELFQAKNPDVDIRLIATWPRADQVYPDSTHWHGHTLESMALDIRKAYDLAAAGVPAVHGIVPVGEAWIRAFTEAVADSNPYDGVSRGQIDLWTYDNYHASAFGYYLYALMTFAEITGLDPRSLGNTERAAFELGFSPQQAAALQRIAFEELDAAKGQAHLLPFQPLSTDSTQSKR